MNCDKIQKYSSTLHMCLSGRISAAVLEEHQLCFRLTQIFHNVNLIERNTLVSKAEHNMQEHKCKQHNPVIYMDNSNEFEVGTALPLGQ